MDGEISTKELRSLLDGAGESAADGAGTGGQGGDESGEAGEADGEVRVVDIRNPGAFARGHIPGSENIPAPELTERVEELDGAGRVVTVCPHGQASVQAARLVGSYRGVDGPVESLAGGLEAWEGPLETDEPPGETGDDATAPF
ncbi:MAG: rhodanese-like domain-containing protein [Haloarculaceae archaeon]